ncbi:MAG: iron ABC transporter permease [Coriobacteriia bacterium]|nr:iron ABC transporter permease [Coriobacteriia bacterium]
MSKLYNKTRYGGVFIVLAIILIVVTIVALSMGHYSYNPMDVIRSIGDFILGKPSADTSMDMVIVNVRLPRIIAAIVIGAALSLSGAVYQGVFRNPLVSPDLLGVSNGACVGAAIAIIFGTSMIAQQVFAFGFGILAVGIAVLIPRLVRNTSNLMLVLAGIITSGFFSSIMALLKFTASEDKELASIVYWQMGSLTKIGFGDLGAILPIVVLCTIVLLALSWRLNILSFGEVEAQTLGMNVKRMRGIIIVCASALTAGCVCISGTIGWIGLVIPHLARLLVGSDHRKMLPITILLGSTFLLVVDTACRTISTLDIPLSVLTGLVGAPFYAWLLWRQKSANLL